MNTVCIPHAFSPYPVITPAWAYESRSKVARSVEFDKKAWKTVRKELNISSTFDEALKKARIRIISLCENAQNNPQSPNHVVQETAIEALEALRKGRVLPTLINATNDESLLFEFVCGEDSYSLDFYNSGEIVFLQRVRGQMLAASEFDRNGLNEAILSILDAYAEANM